MNWSRSLLFILILRALEKPKTGNPSDQLEIQYEMIVYCLPLDLTLIIVFFKLGNRLRIAFSPWTIA